MRWQRKIRRTIRKPEIKQMFHPEKLQRAGWNWYITSWTGRPGSRLVGSMAVKVLNLHNHRNRWLWKCSTFTVIEIDGCESAQPSQPSKSMTVKVLNLHSHRNRWLWMLSKLHSHRFRWLWSFDGCESFTHPRQNFTAVEIDGCESLLLILW